MSDLQALQGLWRVMSVTSQGRAVGHSNTHWEFRGSQMQHIHPEFVDGGAWASFSLDESTSPKRMESIYTSEDRRTVSPVRRVYKACYELEGDTLRVGGAAVYGEYPDAISDSISIVTTLVRDAGPRPETKRASGKAPLEHPVLGLLEWDDNSEQWEGVLELPPDNRVTLSVQPDGSEDATLSSAASLVLWLRGQEPQARAYAAEQMFELAEDWRNEDEDPQPQPITLESFAERITLEGITLEANGEATLWYEDGELFAGHVICVSLDAEHRFTRAEMMG